MSDCDYFLWLSYGFSGTILLPEGTTTVDSEVFQAPIGVTQAIRNLHSVETIIGTRQCNVHRQNLQDWNLNPTGFEFGQ